MEYSIHICSATIQYWLKPIYFSTQRHRDAEFFKFFKEKFSASQR